MSSRSFALVAATAFAMQLSAQWEFIGVSTPQWADVIAEFKALADTRSGATMSVMGTDDNGSPIHLFVLHDGTFPHPDSLRAAGKRILWITNGIHAGEPDGVDASLLLARALLDSDQYLGLLAHTAVCIVPLYNVSGAQQRNSHSRANQNGPEEYGFRANARNLDLNRDFIKADSRNTRDLLKALHHWDPDIYFETHVSNGADHQYVMELLTTHPDRLDPALPRLYYDHDHPTDTVVPWMDRFVPALTITKPKTYLIPQAWREVIARLELDGVPMEVLTEPRKMDADLQRIVDFRTVSSPYEGRYLHHGITTEMEPGAMDLLPGDVLVPMGHPTDRLVMEILEPRASDSFFAWGFFDAILQQKEWFSAYVFEDIAAELLAKDPDLRQALEAAKAADPTLANDAWGQLYWVYQRSPYFEEGYRRYPVARVE